MEQDFGYNDHTQTECVVDMEGDYFSNRLAYRLMRDDVLVLDQQTTFSQAEHSSISPNPKSKFYLINYEYENNQPIEFQFNGQEILMAHAGFLSFCNNLGSHEVFHPAGFEGRSLQIIVDHSFLADYIDLESLEHTSIKDIILGKSGRALTIPSAPERLRERLDNIVRLVYRPTSIPLDKLTMLRAITEVLEVFFEMQISISQVGKQDRIPDIKPSVADVAQYLAENLYSPFPGINNLCKRFSLAETTLKRQFSEQYGTTPHRLFRHLQMEAAKRMLKESAHPVSQIGYLLGFDSPGNFARAFKQCYDTTPSEYRSSFQKRA